MFLISVNGLGGDKKLFISIIYCKQHVNFLRRSRMRAAPTQSHLVIAISYTLASRQVWWPSAFTCSFV